MIEELSSWTALSCVYAVVALVSFLYAVVSLVGAEVGDALDLDVDVDADADAGFDFAAVSPFALAVFGATFGLAGIITSIWFGVESIPSILISAGSGLVIGGAAQVLFIYVLSPSKSSHFSLQEAEGQEAQVTVSIPEGGQGQVTYNNVSGRVNLRARSATGKKIPSGEFVIIEKISGRNAVVRPLDSE